MRYIVKGSDESVVNVDILGEIRLVGEKVELGEEAAAPFVEAGTLELVGEDEQVAEEVATTEDEKVASKANEVDEEEGEEIV